MLNLSELTFKVNTDALVQAAEKIAVLGKSVESLQGSFSKLEKGTAASEKALAEANRKNAQAAKANAEAALLQAKALTEVERAENLKAKTIQSSTKATEESTRSVSNNVSMLQRQQDIYGFMIEGFSRGQSSILATAKAAGILADEMKTLKAVLQDQRALLSDPFDKSLSGLLSLKNELSVATRVQAMYTAELGLTKKQMRELAVDEMRLTTMLKEQGKSTKEIEDALKKLNKEYITTAGSVNQILSAEQALERQRKETADANNAIEREMQRVNYALQTQNNELNKGTANALFRFEQNLKRSGLTLAEQKKKLDDYRTSLLALEKSKGSTQTDYISRALGPQITDIFVGLATGQNPLTVMLQQGGQLRDQFALAGVAAGDMGDTMRRAAKDMVVSVAAVAGAFKDLLVGAFIDTGKGIIKLVSDFTGLGQVIEWSRYQLTLLSFQNEGVKALLDTMNKYSNVLKGAVGLAAGVGVASLVALGVAAYQTMKEQDKLAESLALFNGTLAISQSTAVEYVAALNTVGVTTGNASAAIMQMAKAGVFASEDIMLVAKAAANLADYSSVGVEDTIKVFAKLKEKPVEALFEVAKQTGMVSLETIKMVEELQKAGKQSEASALAMQTYGDVTAQQVTKMKENYSSFGLFVMELGKTIKNFFSDTFKSIFYESTNSLQKQADRLQAQIDSWEQASSVERLARGDAFGYTNDANKYRLQQLKDKIALMHLENTVFEEKIETQGKDAKNQELVNKLMTEANQIIDKATAKTLTLSEYVKKSVEEKTKNVQVSKEELAILKQAAEVEWKAMQKKDRGGSSASSSLDIERTNEVSILEREFTRENKLREKALKDRLSMEKTAYELGRTTKAEYMRNELDILRETLNAEEKATSETLEKREQLYLQDTAAAIAAYQKRVAANAGLKNADKQNADALTNLQTELGNSARAYEDFIEKAKASGEALKSSVSAKEFEVYRKLAENIKETIKAVEEYNFANSNRIREQAQEYSDRKALRWATPEQAAVIKAVAEATKFYAGELAKLQKVAEKAKAVYDDQAYFFGSDSPQAKEALKNYEAALGNVNQAVADARVAKEQAATDAIADYYDAEFKRISDGVTDSIVTALFEGGKSGSKKFRDLVVAELKKPVTMVVSAVVNTILGNIVGSLMGGAAAGAAGSAAGSAGGSLLGSAAGGMLGGVGSGVLGGLSQGFGATMSNGLIGGFGVNMGNIGTLVSGGNFSAALGAAAPYLLAATALISLISGLDDSGTYHTGGAARYSRTGGLSSGQSGEAFDIGFGRVERGDQTISAMASLSKALVDIFDGIAKTFGKTAGYEVAVAFAEDTSEDGAWGAFAVRLQGVEILNWDDFRQSKWAPKEFGDGEEGYKQYLAAVAKDTRKILTDMDIPGWAKTILNDIGENPSMEALSGAIQLLAQVEATFKSFGQYMPQFANLADSAKEALIKASGGVESLTSNMSSFVNAFYTDADKLEINTRNVTDAITALGFTMPRTREEFRALVESQMALGESGAANVAALLALSNALNGILPAFGAAEDAVVGMSDILRSLKEESNNLEIELLRLQGKNPEADARQRQTDIAGFSEAEIAAYDYNRALRQQIEMLQNLAKLQEQSTNLEIELLRARGLTAEADARQRAIDIAGMTEAEVALYDYNRALRGQIDSIRAAANALGGLANTRFDLENQLLTAQGNTTEVNRRNRERDIARLTEGLTEEQAAAVIQAYDYNIALREQIRVQEEANRAAQQAADAANQAAQQAADAAKAVKDAWQSITDSIMEEVKRIRNIVRGENAQSLEYYQQQFAVNTAAARNGDQEAAKMLPELSKTLLDLAEINATSYFELQLYRSRTAASLEETARLLSGAHGTTLPSFDVGTNYVPRDMTARIHQGEAILPKAFNPWAGGNLPESQGTSERVANLENKLAALSNEVRVVAVSTNKINRLLERVSRDGESLQVTVTS